MIPTLGIWCFGTARPSITSRSPPLPTSRPVSGAYRGIVSHALFDAVQRMLEETARSGKTSTAPPCSQIILKGRIFCASCDGSLHQQRYKRAATSAVRSFIASPPAQLKSACPSIRFFEDALLSVVMRYPAGKSRHRDGAIRLPWRSRCSRKAGVQS